MTGTLNVSAKGELDFVAFGALVHRLDPGIVPFRKATECDIHVSGGEFNCAANIADCFGLKTAIVSAMVDYPIGELIDRQVRMMGVRPFYKNFVHDGVSGPNMATVYSDRGYGMRPPEVFYNRANEAASLLKSGDFDWEKIFAGGVKWFHSGGIFAALSPTMPDLIIEGMKAAKKAGAIISFDLNYRDKLWQKNGGKAQAAAVFDKIVKHVDVLIGTDLLTHATERVKDPEVAIQRVLDTYGHIKAIATTRREEYSANRHHWHAVGWVDDAIHHSPVAELDIYDRVGSGDGFASGFFYGLLTGGNVKDAVQLGWAHGGLLTSFPGDTTMSTLERVKAIASGGSAGIQR